MIKTVAAHGAGAEVVGDDVALLDQFKKYFLPGRMRHIHTQALLVARAEVGEVAAFIPPFFARLAIGERPRLAILQVPGAFNADDLRAHIREKRRAPRQGVHLLQC